MQRDFHFVGALNNVIISRNVAVVLNDDTGTRALNQLHLSPHVLCGAGYHDLNYRILILVYYLCYGQLASCGIAEIKL